MGIIYNDNKVIPHIDHSKYYNCKIWYNNVRQNSYDGIELVIFYQNSDMMI